jgi:2-polyprenyl-6-methoxyphenol hydroxylase-like FAD-dependent oxidoreductase
VHIVCVGGGPAGLYLALLARQSPSRPEVTVIERNPPGTAHGWGVTWGEEFLDDVYAADPVSGRRLRAAAKVWGDQVVRVGGQEPVHIGGRYGYCVDRSRMIDVLTERVLELGGRVEYERTVSDPAELDADLVVAADGIGSRLRGSRAATFRPTVTTGRNQYVWLGTPKVFDAFTFAFERTDAGWVWAYGYPSSGAPRRRGRGSGCRPTAASTSPRRSSPTFCRASRCWARRRGSGSRRCATRPGARATSCSRAMPRTPRTSASAREPCWPCRTPSRSPTR